MSVELEYHDTEQNSHKFWRVEVQHCNVGLIDECWQVTTVWGRVGSNGQSKSWAFDNEHQARIAAKSKARMKRRKGYLDLATPVPPVRPRKARPPEIAPEVEVELDAPDCPRVFVRISARSTRVRGVANERHEITVDGDVGGRRLDVSHAIAERLREIVRGYEDEGYRIWRYDVDNVEVFANLSRWLSGRPAAQVKRFSREDMLNVDVAQEFSL